MSGFAERRYLRFIVLAACFLVGPAFAQFEIAPDHFDASDQQTAKQKPSATPRAKPAHQAAKLPHPGSSPANAIAAMKRNQRPRSQQKMARQSKPDAELAASRR
jgi:hypothetical protein